MTKVDLNGQWLLYFFPYGSFHIANPKELKQMDLKPIRATVPGNVELDLVDAGILPDPFFGNNIQTLESLEDYEWWYSKEFTIPQKERGKRAELVFHGVDCIAVYWLNGKEIGKSDNMFIEHRFDATGKLIFESKNTLVIKIKSPITEAAAREYDPLLKAGQSNWDHLWVRKAPHSYGWDIMPRALSAGLWRPVELIFHDETEITDITFTTKELSKNKAKVEMFFQVAVRHNSPQQDPNQVGSLQNKPILLLDSSAIQERMGLRIIGNCKKSHFDVSHRITFEAGSLDIEIDDPLLWWPIGYGDPNLYNVSVQLKHGSRVLTEREFAFGIRKVDLIRTDTTTQDYPGEFLFKINEVPILCKGSNWVPADVFHSRDVGRYEAILSLFKDLGCNILRCWGGNVYEDHLFYDICDRYGIMVWQDFAMACARYPQDPQFLLKIRKEATSVVRKLRNHASIILWCGDNECDELYEDPSKNRITREVLPQVVFQCDPSRHYLPSSPFFSHEAARQDSKRLMPEQHLWGPRGYFKSPFYANHTAHFVSEIGYHGCPNLSSIKRFIDEDHLWPWQDNDQWITHSTDSLGKEGNYAYRIQLMADQIKELFGTIPDNLEDFILASQICQAEALKFFIEMTRLKKWKKTGIIWWNVMDGWPQFSDSVVDYYFGKKLAYHYIKRIQQPICLMIAEPRNSHVGLFAGNDSREQVEGEYWIRDADSEEILREGRFVSFPNQNVELGQVRISRGEQKMLLLQWKVGEATSGNHYLFGVPCFDLEKYRDWLKKISRLSPGFPFLSTLQ